MVGFLISPTAYNGFKSMPETVGRLPNLRKKLFFSLFHHLHQLSVHLFMKTEGVRFVNACANVCVWVDFPATKCFESRKYSREFDRVAFKVASPLQLMKATNWNPQTQCKRHLASKLSSNILENWMERLRRSRKWKKWQTKKEKKTKKHLSYYQTVAMNLFEEHALNV